MRRRQRIPFGQRIATSWRLLKTSGKVALHDKELILLSVFAGIIVIVGWAILGLFVSLLSGESVFGLADTTEEEISGSSWAIIGTGAFLAALWAGVVGNFFRGAQIAGAYERLTGGDPTIRSSLKVAAPVWMQLAKWGILTASVSFALGAIRAMARGRGGADLAIRLATRLVGAAWNFITFLALPVVVFEGLPPIKAAKRSAQMLKETWGARLIGGLATEFFSLLMVLSAAVLGVFVFVISSSQTFAIIIASIYLLVGVLYWLLLTATYQTALYIYATTNEEPDPFKGVGFDKFFVEKASK